MQSLPKDVLLELFSHLDNMALINMSAVCSSFHALCRKSSRFLSLKPLLLPLFSGDAKLLPCYCCDRRIAGQRHARFRAAPFNGGFEEITYVSVCGQCLDSSRRCDMCCQRVTISESALTLWSSCSWFGRILCPSCAASAGSQRPQDDPALSKYFRMVDLGVHKHHVCLKMRREGLQPALLGYDLVEHEYPVETPPAPPFPESLHAARARAVFGAGGHPSESLFGDESSPPDTTLFGSEAEELISRVASEEPPYFRDDDYDDLFEFMYSPAVPRARPSPPQEDSLASSSADWEDEEPHVSTTLNSFFRNVEVTYEAVRQGFAIMEISRGNPLFMSAEDGTLLVTVVCSKLGVAPPLPFVSSVSFRGVVDSLESAGIQLRQFVASCASLPVSSVALTKTAILQARHSFKLPPDLWKYIFSLLPKYDLLICVSPTCRLFYHMSRDAMFYERKKIDVMARRVGSQDNNVGFKRFKQQMVYRFRHHNSCYGCNKPVPKRLLFDAVPFSQGFISVCVDCQSSVYECDAVDCSKTIILDRQTIQRLASSSNRRNNIYCDDPSDHQAEYSIFGDLLRALRDRRTALANPGAQQAVLASTASDSDSSSSSWG